MISGTSNMNAMAELEGLNREGLKYSEEELKILHEEPDDLIKNLETLISVRSAFENEAPRTTTNMKSRNLKRRHDADNVIDSPAPTPDPTSAVSRPTAKGTSRSGSVAASVKQESIIDSTEGAIRMAQPLRIMNMLTSGMYSSFIRQASPFQGRGRSVLQKQRQED